MTLKLVNSLVMGLTGASLSLVVWNGFSKLGNVVLAAATNDTHITESNTWVPVGLAVAITIAIGYGTYHVTNYARDQKEAIKDLRNDLEHIKQNCSKCSYDKSRED